ncbi:MAG: threonine/serine exporter family protein [Flammeovirgaceae bacterium]|nr:threonine/serine exporter family protein [Flammeovirgaceae bacterium]
MVSSAINTEVERLISLPHYPRLLVLFVVSLAGASFCRLFDGSWQDMIVAFMSNLCRVIYPARIHEKKFQSLYANIFRCFYFFHGCKFIY